MGKYIYDIRDCDVTDRVSVQTFRQKREQWSTWLDDDPDHAIWNVIHTLVWRDTNFAAISKLALENPTGPLHTTLIGETLVSGHVTMQVMALRRLIDRRRDVISLPRLITDLKANWQLLTRENFVCFDGLPYDYEAAAREFWKDKKPEGAIWVDTTGPLAYGTSERLHRHFDRLAGISPTDRKRHDVLPKTLIATVERWLLNSRAMDVAEWSHVHVAHAANAQNREAIAHVQVTNNTISAAIREIARVAEAISGEILYIGGRLGALMPIAQYDIFDRLERPIASTPIRKVAEEAWDAKTQEWDEAVRDVADDLLK